MSLNSVLWQSVFLSVHVPKFTSRIIFLPAQEARTFLWSIFLNVIWLCLYKYYKSIELFILHSLQLKICIRPMSHAMMPVQWCLCNDAYAMMPVQWCLCNDAYAMMKYIQPLSGWDYCMRLSKQSYLGCYLAAWYYLTITWLIFCDYCVVVTLLKLDWWMQTIFIRRFLPPTKNSSGLM